MTDIENLEISIKALTAYSVGQPIIKDMLKKLDNINNELKKVSRVELPSSVAEPNQPIFTIREVERMLADQRLSCMKQRYYQRYNGVKKMEEAILNAPPPQEFIDKIIVKIP